MNITETLSAFVSETDVAAIPSEVSNRALTLAMDLFGSAIRAANDIESSASILAMANKLGLGNSGSCTVLGLNCQYGAAAAALLNGTFGHSLDFDDTHSDSSLHPSASVVPAALAAAELVDASGRQFLTAVVIGFEVCCRIGMALNPTAHYARGFHPTATAGTFGAAAAAGRLLGLSPLQMTSAFGIAAGQASGLLQFLENGAWNKRYQVGEASMKGLIAASLASEGFLGAVDAIEGKHGFLKGYSDAPNLTRAIAGLNEVWETMRIGIKLYPACRYTHAALDGLLRLQREHDWHSDEVSHIIVGLHRNGVALVGEPLSAKQRVRSIVEGQFSMPFAASVALLRRGFGWDDYNLLGTHQVDVIAGRVEVEHDSSLEGLRHPFGATLWVKARGETFTLRIDDPSGEPESFPSASILEEKFTSLVRPVLNAEDRPWLERLALLPQAPSMRTLFS